MSNSSRAKQIKRLERKRKQKAMSETGYESRNNSDYARKVLRRERNINSPFYGTQHECCTQAQINNTNIVEGE